MFPFHEWLLSWPRWLRYGFALLLIFSSILSLEAGWVWPWGWLFGGILLWHACFCKRHEE